METVYWDRDQYKPYIYGCHTFRDILKEKQTEKSKVKCQKKKKNLTKYELPFSSSAKNFVAMSANNFNML